MPDTRDLWLANDLYDEPGPCKYRYCAPAQDGLLYANSDFCYDGPFDMKPDALPKPDQQTEKQTARARRMHEAAAQMNMHRMLAAVMASRPKAPPTLWQQIRNHLGMGR